jgi:long-chain acyl-CoA synthetase
MNALARIILLAVLAAGAAACAPFAHKAATQRTTGERLTYAFWYWIILRALQNFIGLRRAQVALTGAAPIPPAVVQFFRTLGVPLVEVYGLTESTGMITGQPLDAARFGSVGTPILGVEYRIGDRGELLIRGEMVFAGYYKNPEATWSRRATASSTSSIA